MKYYMQKQQGFLQEQKKSRQDLSYNNSLCGYIRLQWSWARLWHYVIMKTDTHIVKEHLVSMFRIQASIVSMQLHYVGNLHGRWFN